MKLLAVALLSALTWCGLIVGVAVGAAFGTLASMSALFCAFINPSFHEELRRTEQLAGAAVTLAVERVKEAYARHRPSDGKRVKIDGVSVPE